MLCSQFSSPRHWQLSPHQSNVDEQRPSSHGDSEHLPKRQKIKSEESDSSQYSEKAALLNEEFFLQSIHSTGNIEGAKAFERAARKGRLRAMSKILALMADHPGEARPRFALSLGTLQRSCFAF